MAQTRNNLPTPLKHSGLLASNAGIIAKERWEASTSTARVLARVLKNWRSATPTSSVSFEVENLRYGGEIRALSQAIKIEGTVYRPTGYGLALMVLLSVDGSRRFAGVCARAYDLLRKLYLKDPEQAKVGLATFREQLDIDRNELTRVLLILADLSVASVSTGAYPHVYPFHAIREQADIWAVFESILRTYVQPTYGAYGAETSGLNAVLCNPSGSAYGVVGICSEALDDCRKAHERLLRDPTGAITSARSMLESAIKWIHHQHGAGQPSKDGSTGRRLKDCLRLMDAKDNDFEKPGIKVMISGMETAVNGLDSARNAMSDGHGKSPATPLANTRIAHLVLSLAMGVTTFLLATYESRQRP